MNFTSPHIDATCEHGTATLGLRFPGRPVNALDLDRLRELDRALAAVEASPAVRVLVLRSNIPGGFCEGLHSAALASLATPADAAAFSWYGQRVLRRLAGLEVPTVAFLDGACLGAGLELALACDYRLALANVSAPIGFPAPVTAFGGTARLTHRLGRTRAQALLHSREPLSAREAQRIGLVDLAFCERRAKIELRTFLDSLERRPLKPRRFFKGEEGFATERREFARFAMNHDPLACTAEVVFPAQASVFSMKPEALELAADLAVRGVRVAVLTNEGRIADRIEAIRRRGFLTPLEAEQARGRLTVAHTTRGASLVLTANVAEALALESSLNPRCILAVEGLETADLPRMQHPQRVVGLRWDGERVLTATVAVSRADSVGSVFVGWMETLGLTVHVHLRPSEEHARLRGRPFSRLPVAA